MKILKITLITLAVLALAGWFFLFRSVPLKISPETTILTEPRTEDGRWVDYRAYLIAQFPKDGNTEKNSARGMLALFGEAGDVESFKDYWKMLGLEPPEENQKAPFSISDEILLDEKFDDCKKVEDYFAADPDAVREYVSAATPALDAMTEVIQKAEFFAFPVVPNSLDDLVVSARTVDVVGLLEVLNAFRFRAWLREKDGDQEGADADRLTLLKLGRQIQNKAMTLVMLLLGKEVEKVGAGLKDPEKWKTLEPIDREANLRRALELERLFAASAIQNFCRLGRNGNSMSKWVYYDGIDELFVWPVMYLGFDWNIVAKRLNETTQKIYFPEENAVPFEVPRHSWWEIPKLFSRRARSEIWADVLGSSVSIDQSRQFLLEEVSPPAP